MCSPVSECDQLVAASEAMGYTEDAPVSLGWQWQGERPHWFECKAVVLVLETYGLHGLEVFANFEPMHLKAMNFKLLFC